MCELLFHLYKGDGREVSTQMSQPLIRYTIVSLGLAMAFFVSQLTGMNLPSAVIGTTLYLSF